MNLARLARVRFAGLLLLDSIRASVIRRRAKIKGQFVLAYSIDTKQGTPRMTAAATDNLALWNDFSATDPAYTKAFNRGGGFSGTAINAAYVIRKLTEKFGPCGVGWRLVREHDEFVTGHALDAEGVTRCVIHVFRGRLEYMAVPVGVPRNSDPVWVATGPQYGQTTFVGVNKNGFFTDEEAPKKSVTDCLGKCALLLGVGADIHMGEWDDNKYLNDPTGGAPAKKPRSKAASAAAPAPTVSAGGVDLTNVNIAIGTAAEPAELLVVFEDLRRSPAIYQELRTWEQVCGLVAARFTAINKPDTNEAKILVGGLQAERVRLDQARSAQGNAAA